MVEKLSISLFPVYKEHFPHVKKYLEKIGHNVTTYDKNMLDAVDNFDLAILFVNELTPDIIKDVQYNFKNLPVIINYNHCPEEVLLKESPNSLTFIEKQELDKIPELIEKIVPKRSLLTNEVEKDKSKSSILNILNRIVSLDLNKIHFDEFIKNVLAQITSFSGADDYEFFLLSKFGIINSALAKDLTDKYTIDKINQLYPEIEYDSMINNLKKNQELIIFKKDGNVKADILDHPASKHFYFLIILPLFINNTLYGCTVFNYKNAVENIDELRQELFLIIKIFNSQLQYKLLYNQYESSINQFSRLINEAINGIYQSTDDGKILYANPAFLKIIGYDSLEELKRVDLFTQVYNSKSDRENFIKKIKKEKAVQNYESVLKKKNGDLINVIENSRIVKNADGSILFEGIIQDITNQINLKEKLNYQTSFSEKLVENASILIFAVNEKNEVIMWNSLAEITTGYSRNEVFVDSGLLKQIFCGIESFEDYISKIRKYHNIENYSTNDNIEILSKDGSKKIFRFSWIVNDYLSEAQKQVIGFGINITETVKLEEQLFESQKMESIGTLAAGMTYDFTSILNEINVYNSSLKSIVVPESRESDYVDKIDDTINRASTFTSKLIGLSRREKRKTSEIDVNNCLNYVLDILEHTIDENIELEKDICTLPLIEGDLSQIHQVILNIAINANESIATRGKISFKTEIVMAKTDENLNQIKTDKINFVKITITDTGKGIPVELQQRIFDPFFTTKTSDKSAGFGLSVVYNIVKNHHGYIFVESALNNGSSFYIYFPYVGEPSANFSSEVLDFEESKVTAPKKRKDKPQILIVDDEVIIRDLLNDVLIDHNYEIISAKDGFEGLKKYQKNMDTIDLVILDIIMPGMTGDEVFKKMRAINPDSKIIITSGYSKQKITEELMTSGANGFLPKPFNIDKLLGLIKALVEEK